MSQAVVSLTGEMIIAGQPRYGQAGQARSFDPRANTALDPAYGLAGEDDVDQACQAAAEAFDPYRALPLAERANFLRAIADEIERAGPEIISRAVQESGLLEGRIQGELGRTTGQLRMFADDVVAGRWLDARVDTAQPGRRPAARPDLRTRAIGVGPVVVFGASNFPLAFSVAGGDTASALAAGCPVIVKGHGAHLGTGELVGRAIARAASRMGMPPGVFSLIFGAGSAVGQALVTDPRVKAVGFTGSQAGGTALMRAAASRPEPIPVYAEMSSINPCFLLHGALAADATGIADGFVASLTLGAGQSCTNPGLVVAERGAGYDAFVVHATALVGKSLGQTMLTRQIHSAFGAGVDRLTEEERVTKLGTGLAGTTENSCTTALFEVSAEAFLAQPFLQEEVFGPAATIVRCDDADQVAQVAAALQGQLTVSIHAVAADAARVRALLPVLERKAGRIIANGWPTGVEVCHAIVHGGPFPATSDGRTTSVGTLAIRRFLRPVCYQGFDDWALPEQLTDAGVAALPRLVDGQPVDPAQ